MKKAHAKTQRCQEEVGDVGVWQLRVEGRQALVTRHDVGSGVEHGWQDERSAGWEGRSITPLRILQTRMISLPCLYRQTIDRFKVTIARDER